MKSVGVLGLGTMGSGIAEVMAKNGYSVIGVDRDDPSVERGRAFMTKSLGRAVERGRISQIDADAIIGRTTFTTDRQLLSHVDLVIEAIPEILEWKEELFTDLDRILKADAIIATNTSSLSITTIAGFTSRPSRVLGMHFFNPAPVQPLVEIITHSQVEDEVVSTVVDLVRAMKKKPVVVGDQPGFLVNALLVPYLNHAAEILGRGDVEPSDLDAAMVTAGFAPMGPAALIDLVGVDVHIEVSKVLYNAFGSPELAPAASALTLAEAGHLGRKSGRGYYDYSSAIPQTQTPSDTAQRYARWLNARYLNAAARMLESGYASAEDIDTGMTAGCGYKVGPITAANEYGIAKLIADLNEFHDAYGFAADEACAKLQSSKDGDLK